MAFGTTEVVPWQETEWKVEKPDGRWWAFAVSHPLSKKRADPEGTPMGHSFISCGSAKPVED
jgi:hypothetical protein